MAETSTIGKRQTPTASGSVHFDVDLTLIGLTMLVTVPRVGWWMARWEQADLWFVGYAAAVVFDLASLRLAYVWRRTGNRRSRLVTGFGFAFFAACSGVFQAFYLLSQSATLAEAGSLASIWPVALGILALHKAGQDEGQDRRAARSGTRASRRPDVPAGHQAASDPALLVRTPSGRRNVWTPEQRQQALRLAGSGLSVRKVAQRVGVPRSTAGAWLRSAAPVLATTGRSSEAGNIGVPVRSSGEGTRRLGDAAADVRNDEVDRVAAR